MVFLSINAETGEIYGRVREATPTSVEVDDELFGRYLSAPDAFLYYPDRNTIDLRPDYSAPKILSIPPAVIETYQGRVQEEVFIPELEVNVCIAGALGRAFLTAISLAPYQPQTVLIHNSGDYTTIEINKSNLKYFAAAYAKHFASIVGNADE